MVFDGTHFLDWKDALIAELEWPGCLFAFLPVCLLACLSVCLLACLLGSVDGAVEVKPDCCRGWVPVSAFGALPKADRAAPCADGALAPVELDATPVPCGGGVVPLHAWPDILH